MTRFEKEISGSLGQWWKNHAEKELAEAVVKANEEAIVEETGAIKWKSNDSYLMDDFCEKLEYAGYNFSREATKKAREAELSRFFEEYRRNYKEPTEEEKAEMRAAFGEDAEIVDVIARKKIRL